MVAVKNYHVRTIKKIASDVTPLVYKYPCMGTAEGIALEVLRTLGVSAPTDARQLCEACGVKVRRWSHRFGARAGDAIWYPERATLERRQWIVAHELGHWLLEDYGLDPRDEDGANSIAAALLMPRESFRSSARHESTLRPLAKSFGVHETAAALRLAEAGIVEAAIVFTPERIYAKGANGRAPMFTRPMTRIDITDDYGRVAWVAR